MTNGKNSGVLRAFLGASFLMTLTIILLFFYFQTLTPNNRFFPNDTLLYNTIYTTYLMAFALILIIGVIIAPREVKALATANYWKSIFQRFIPSFIVTFIILLLIKGIIKGASGLDPVTALKDIPIAVLVTHLFVVSQIEEIMFAGITFESISVKYGLKAANWITMGMFSIFHYSKTGSLIATVIYLPLRYWWNYISNNGYPVLRNMRGIGRFFQPTPRTQQSNAGSHFAYNLFVTGLT